MNIEDKLAIATRRLHEVEDRLDKSQGWRFPIGYASYDEWAGELLEERAAWRARAAQLKEIKTLAATAGLDAL